MKNLKNKVAGITGAASGIGRALALNLADEGCHLAISDINEAVLRKPLIWCALEAKTCGLLPTKWTLRTVSRSGITRKK
jgi:NAD(P)-dependent dehydrogenase (short-subunit alcohol dehydrogenase family)